MPALFPPWSTTALRVGLVALLTGGALLVVVAPMIYVRTPFFNRQLDPLEQPAQFDHRHHVRDNGMDCRYCHSSVERAATAGVPSTSVCMGCHAQVWPDSAALEPVLRSWFSDTAIPWNRVHKLPDHVYFDHSAHTNGGIGCVSCHGRVDEMAAVFQVAPLTMSWCLGCHRSPESNLRPLESVTDMEWRAPGDREAFGRLLAAQYGTRKLDDCSTCHR